MQFLTTNYLHGNFVDIFCNKYRRDIHPLSLNITLPSSLYIMDLYQIQITRGFVNKIKI